MSWLGQTRSRKYNGFVLALSGGGGRGLAHLGVLEVLDGHGLRPDAIVGTSIGAMFGAMYALKPDAVAVRKHVLEYVYSDAFQSLDLPRLEESDAQDDSWLSRLTSAARQSLLYAKGALDTSFLDVQVLTDIVDALCPEGSFADMQIPLYVTVVKFPGGECHVFSSGNLAQALTASMAIPGVFNPVEIEGERYLDGGLASEVPAVEACEFARDDQFVVAVNTGARPNPERAPNNVMGMMDWAASVKSLYLRHYEKAHAHVLIEPLVGYTQWQDFAEPEREIARGREAALEVLPELKRLLKK